MKKLFALILVFAMALSLAACGHKEAGNAYAQLAQAQTVLDEMAADLRSVYTAGTGDPAAVQDGGMAYIAQDLNLSLEEFTDGAAIFLCQEDWETLPEDQRDGMRAATELALKIYTLTANGTFELCCPAVVYGYQYSGKLQPALDIINQVGTAIEQLKEDKYYNDLVNYHFALKSYVEYMLDYPDGASLEMMLDEFDRLNAEGRAELDAAFAK